jgi:competence protein ComEA
MPRKWLDDYFGFNRQQRKGVLVLAALCVTLLAVRIALPYIIKPQEVVIANLPMLEAKVDSVIKNDTVRHDHRRENQSKPLFTFDPNTVTGAELSDLGLKEKTIRTFMKFRSRGFAFRKKSDLKKVYGISDRMYARLEPYIVIAPRELQSNARPEKISGETKAVTIASKPQQVAVPIELNSADSASLESLPGIGGAFAKRILKYRELLGGFTETQQLREVFGITEETFSKASPLLTVNAELISRIKVNADDFKTVNRHPYISYDLTKAIFNLRRKQRIGNADLERLIANDSISRKLRPYVSFE